MIVAAVLLLHNLFVGSSVSLMFVNFLDQIVEKVVVQEQTSCAGGSV